LLRRDLDQGLEFRSREIEALIRSKALKGEKAVLVCSEKLTEENWEGVEVGTLLAINSSLEIKEIKIL